MSEVLIKAEHVSKKFSRSLKRSLWYGMKDVVHSLNPFVHDTDQESDAFKPKELRPGEFWALQGINFEVRRGECLGLIGHNGAGKSTLLKILNGLIRPDTGRITMKGRVGALIELSAGFNPILTGRENIYTQAALLGFTKSEVDRKFDAIVDFSELEDFLEMPLQNYSSGMKVKLGFAVSSQLEPDILLLDEVLAVGDIGFRAKCMQRMGELIDRCAVIFVSHSMPSVARVASTILHLHHGETKLLTTSLNEGMSSYYRTFSTGSEIRTGTGEVEVDCVKAVCDDRIAQNQELLEVNYGETIEFKVDCRFTAEQSRATIHLLIWSQEMIPVLELLAEQMTRFVICPDEFGRCSVSTTLPQLTLNTGRYTVSIIVLSEDGMTCFRMLDRAIELQVNANHGSGACIVECTQWTTCLLPAKL